MMEPFQMPALQENVLMITGWISILLAAFYLFWHSGSSRPRRRLPPGPPAFPVLGNLVQLAGHEHPHRAMAAMAQKYGHIVFLRLGQVPTVVVDSMELINKITKDLDTVFCSRPTMTYTRIMLYDQHDFGMAPYGAYWRHIRRLCVNELLTPKRTLGSVAIRNQENLLAINAIAEAGQRNQAIDMRKTLMDLSLNVIIRMMIGRQVDGEVLEFKEFVHEALRLLTIQPIQDFLPFLAWFKVQSGTIKKMHKVHEVQDFALNTTLQEHRDLASGKLPGEKPDDFLSVLLDAPGANGEPHLDDRAIKACVSDMLGGTDTSVVLNEWAMTEIIKHPEVQRKLHAELDLVVGNDRVVEDADLTHLRYLICIVKETQRLRPPNCFTLPRQSMEDVQLAGYDIPKGSTILFNIFAMGRDPAVWEDPLKFDPERWADSTTPTSLADDRLFVFGGGRRSCPGYNLGTTLVLLPLARFFHAFEWSFPPGVCADDIDMSEARGFSNPRKERLLAVAKPRAALHLYGVTL